MKKPVHITGYVRIPFSVTLPGEGVCAAVTREALLSEVARQLGLGMLVAPELLVLKKITAWVLPEGYPLFEPAGTSPVKPAGDPFELPFSHQYPHAVAQVRYAAYSLRELRLVMANKTARAGAFADAVDAWGRDYVNAHRDPENDLQLEEVSYAARCFLLALAESPLMQ
jgi:hypothetical protein